MAGRKSIRKSNRTDAKVENKSTGSPFVTLSPNGELRQRLIDASIDVKENIPVNPEQNQRITTRSQNRLIGRSALRPASTDGRKRRSVQVRIMRKRKWADDTNTGPPAKRTSAEKDACPSSEEDDSGMGNARKSVASSSTSSSSSISSRKRGKALPVMEEEEEETIFASLDESTMKEGSDGSVHNEEEESDREDDSFEDEEDDVFEDEVENSIDEINRPLENIHFHNMKIHMNQPTLIDPPISMKERKCAGIGSPEKVWSVMVSRDDLARASKCLLNYHPEMSATFRCILIDWMMEVCETENLHRETFHLSVDYVDRLLEAAPLIVNKSTFQLVGATALFVAAKYEEIYPPKCEDFANLTDGSFDANSIRKMEIQLVDALNWTLGPITSVQWLSTYLQLLGQKLTPCGEEHIFETNYFVPELMREDFIHMAKILDFLLFDIDSLAFSYRTISAAVLFACYEPRNAVENATGFVYDQILSVIEYVEPVVNAFEKSRLAGDPFPNKKKIHPDDMHNIQTYFVYDKYNETVKKERLRLLKMR